jgi:hypothetical protein
MAGDKEAQELEEWKLRAAEFHTRAEQAERERDAGCLCRWDRDRPREDPVKECGYHASIRHGWESATARLNQAKRYIGKHGEERARRKNAEFRLASQAERIAALEAAIRECPPHDVECATNDSYGESCECWLGYLHTLAGKAGQS